MKRLAIAALAVLLAAQAARADVPRTLGYQGRLLKADGTAATGQVTVTFAIYSDADGGTAVWSEQQKLALADGFYATYLGAASPLPAEIFDGTEKYLELAVDNTPLVPRQKLATVPYALHAFNAENLHGGTVDATSLAVNGTAVIDGNGHLAGPARYLPGNGVQIDPTSRQISLLTSCDARQILKWDGSNWTCADDSGAAYSAGSGLMLSGNAFSLTNGCAAGQLLKWNGTSWACAADDNAVITAGSGLEKTGTTLGLKSGCNAGEVLKFDGAAWACAADTDSTYKAGSGLALTGSTFSLTKSCLPGEILAFDGTGWACSPDADTTYKAGAGLALSGTTFSLPKTCGSGQILKWDGTSWSCAEDGGATYTAGAGLKLTGNAFSLTTACASGEILKWDGTTWKCAADANSTVVAGAGIELSGSTVSLLKSCSANQILKFDGTTWACAPDTDTTYRAGSGLSLSGNTFSLKACAAGEVLAYDGTSWGCAADQNTAYAAGSGLKLAGTTFSLTSACAAGDILKWDGAKWNCAADDNAAWVAGSGIAITGNTVSLATGCTANQVLKWSGTAWACATDQTGASSFAAGPGLELAGATFQMKTTCSAGQLLKWNGTDWACAADSQAAITAGSGITIDSANKVAVDFPTASATAGSATTAARSDHNHDDKYYTKAEVDAATSSFFTRKYTVVLALRSETYCPAGWNVESVNNLMNGNSILWISLMSGGGVQFGGNYNNWANSGSYQRISASSGITRICWKQFDTRGRPHTAMISMNAASPNANLCPTGWTFLPSAETKSNDGRTMWMSHEGGVFVGGLDTDAYSVNGSYSTARSGSQFRYWTSEQNMMCFKVMGVEQDPATKYGVYPVVLGVNNANNCPTGFTYVPYSLASGTNDWTYLTIQDSATTMGGLNTWGQYGENYNNAYWQNSYGANWCFKFYPSTGGRPLFTVHQLAFTNCASGELSVPITTVSGNNASYYAQRDGYGLYFGNLYSWGVQSLNDGWWRDTGAYNGPVQRACLKGENVTWP